MKYLITGFVIGVLLLPTAALLYVWFGYAPVATAAPPLPLERAVTHAALEARIEREAPKASLVPATEANLAAGAVVYRDHCEICHGTPDGTMSPTAKGMFPQPPQLLRGKGVTDDPVGETYWKAANGIRLTGMPAYRGSLSNEQLWQVSELLATADKLPESVRSRLTAHPSN